MFDSIAGISLAAVLILIVAIQPWWTYRSERAVAKAPPRSGALARMYWFSGLVKAGWCVLIAALVLLAPGVTPGDVGVAWPRPVFGAPLWVTAAAVSVIAVMMIGSRLQDDPGALPAQQQAMVPQTRRERAAAAVAFAVTGVGEEALYRGFLIAAGVAAGLPPLWAAVLAGAVFIGSHFTQGRRMAALAVPTILVTYLYLATGSLLYPVIVHALINTPTLFLPARSARTTEAEPAEPAETAGV